MKKQILTLVVLLSAVLLTGCEKYKGYEAPFQLVPADKGKMKIVYASAYALNRGVQLSIDDVRVSGLVTSRTPFPGGGYNTQGSSFPDYLVVEPGTRKFSIAIPKAGTNVDSVVLHSGQINVTANTFQSLYVMDTLANTKLLMVKDDVSMPGAGKLRFRFVNLMPNAPLLDLYFGTEKVASSIPYNTEGVVFEMNVPPASLAWTIREPGSSTVLATYSSASTIISNRVYTAFAMGYKGATPANTKPYISFSLNR